MDFSSITGSLAGLPMDWIAIGGFIATVAFDTFRAGAGRAIALSLAFPLAYLLFDMLPDTFFVGQMLTQLSPMMQGGVFILLVLVFAALINWMTESFDSSSVRMLPALLTGIATCVVVLVVWNHADALKTLWQFDPLIGMVFGEAYRVALLAGAFVALAIARS